MRYTERWFQAHTVKQVIDSLLLQLAAIQRDFEDFDQPANRPNDTAKLAWAVAAFTGLALVLLVGAVVGSGGGWQRLTPQKLLSLVGMIGTVAGGAGWMTYLFSGTTAKKRHERDQAIFELVQRKESLRPGHYAPLSENVGTFPWLATELDLLAHCNYFGNHNGLPFVALEYTYVVDTLLSRLDSSIGKLAAKVMSHVEHQQVRRQEAEVILFLEPIENLPDVFFSAKKEPQRWYFQEMLARTGVEPDGVASRDRWLACSEADRSKDIYHCLAPITKSHPTAFVQVLGGYCAVITKSWTWNRPADMPRSVEEIERNLEMAVAVYSALQETHATVSPQRVQNSAHQQTTQQAEGIGSPADFSVAD